MRDIDLIFNTRKDWSNFQINLLIALIHKVEKQDEVLNSYKIKAKDVLIEKLSFEELKNETNFFLSKVYEIQIGNKLTRLSIFSKISFVIGEGIIEVSLNPIFKNYFWELKEKYTLVTLKNILKFQSVFSKKIYLLLKKSNQKIVQFSIQELKEKLAVQAAYKDYNTFKKRVILQSQKELHQTDMAFFFKEIKKSRKVDIIQFEERQNIVLSNHQKELQKKLMKETKITDNQSKRIVIKFTPQEIHSILYKVKEANNLGYIKTSLAGYTVSTFDKILSQKN